MLSVGKVKLSMWKFEISLGVISWRPPPGSHSSNDLKVHDHVRLLGLTVIPEAVVQHLSDELKGRLSEELLFSRHVEIVDKRYRLLLCVFRSELVLSLFVVVTLNDFLYSR